MEKEEFQPGIYDISNARYQAAKGLSRTQPVEIYKPKI